MRVDPGAWLSRDGMARLLDALCGDRGETRPVGGVVRDAILGMPEHDVDLATRHPPEESMRRVREAGFKAVPTGLAHGTVTALLPSGPVEVTTLRRDVATDGRHATVAFTEDWQADAARRDFTMNALLAEPGDGTVIDFFDGLADLAARRVRFIGDPLERIREDHLRILRFFRFHARFGEGAPEAAGLAACTARANDLMALSRERIADELMKLLALPDPVATVRVMVAHAILRPVLPEIDAEGVARLAGLVAREAALAVAGDPLRRLAALLPADAGEAIGARLRLSKQATRRLAAAAGEAGGPVTALAYRVGAASAVDRLLLAGTADRDAMAALAGWERPRLPLTGGTLIALGLAPGRAVAATLAEVERRWIGEGFPDAERAREIARAAVAEQLAGRG